LKKPWILTVELEMTSGIMVALEHNICSKLYQQQRFVSTTTTVPDGATRKRDVLDVLAALNGPSNILNCVDFKLPMDGDVTMTDDGTIKGALSTIRAVLQAVHMPILCSHMGRPELVQKGPVDDAAVIPSSL
jgi:hypothetical protein